MVNETLFDALFLAAICAWAFAFFAYTRVYIIALASDDGRERIPFIWGGVWLGVFGLIETSVYATVVLLDLRGPIVSWVLYVIPTALFFQAIAYAVMSHFAMKGEAKIP